MEAKIKIKKCPFCASPANVVCRNNFDQSPDYWLVICSLCKARTPIFLESPEEESAKQNAIDHWNMRSLKEK